MNSFSPITKLKIHVYGFAKRIVVGFLLTNFGSRVEWMNWRPLEVSLHEVMNMEVMRVVMKVVLNIEIFMGGEKVEERALKNIKIYGNWMNCCSSWVV